MVVFYCAFCVSLSKNLFRILSLLTEFNIDNYIVSLGTHKNLSVIFFDFPNDLLLRSQLKAKIKVKWSNSKKKWYAIDMPQYRDVCNLPRKTIITDFLPKVNPINQSAIHSLYNELVIRGYSPNTIRTYLTEFYQLLKILHQYPVDNLNADRLKSYLVYCMDVLALKESTLHSRINAIKFYFEKVLQNNEFNYSVPRPKKQNSLPKVISKHDIKKMLDLTSNLKHKLALQLTYGMGLRVSEVVALKISDIDSKRMMVHIRSAKGKRDRYTPLPETTLLSLREYYKLYKPKDFLFEGAAGGQFTKRSVQTIFKQALTRANINKKIGIHGLRHSYATHLLESGTDSMFIQKLLGHKDIKTTLIYTRVSKPAVQNIASPLDTLE